MIKINVVGDISLNNIYEDLSHKGQSPFEAVKNIFIDADFNIGNLECLSDDSGHENKLKKPRLKTSPNTLDLLSELKFNALNLAHNHIYDACDAGIACTCNKLSDLSIDYFGYSQDKTDPFIKTFSVGGKCISIISAVHKDTNPRIPENSGISIPYYDADKIKEHIKCAKQRNSFVIVYLHWGGRTEEGFMPDWYEIKDSRSFIESGADIVIGGHSHTVQPFEKYKGKYIFYSIGNFCFDDIHSDGVLYPIGRYRKRRGIIVSINICEKNDKCEVKIIPIKNKSAYIYFNPIYKIRIFIRNIAFSILKHSYLLWKINFILFRKLSPLWIYAIENPSPLKEKLSKLSVDKISKQFKQK